MSTGGPAFPLAASTGDPRDGVCCQSGMTLLDYMAGQVMSGFISCKPLAGNRDWYAAEAYKLASAMLAEKARREAVDHPVIGLDALARERDQAIDRMTNLEAKTIFLETALREAAATLDKENNPVATKLFAAMARSKGMA